MADLTDSPPTGEPHRPTCGKCGEVHLDQHGKPGCTGHKKNPPNAGRPCRKPLRPGQKACDSHGGKAPQAVAAAERRAMTRAVEADARAALAHAGVVGVEDPLAEIARLASEAIAFKDALAARVNALHEIRYEGANGGEQLRTEVALYERALDRTVRFLDVLAKSGFEERRVQIDEQTAAQVVGLLQRVFARLGLSAEQQLLVGEVVPQELRALGGAA